MGRVTIDVMEVLASDIARIRPTNLRVPLDEFVALWAFAERFSDEHPADWHAAGAVMTCRWLANAIVRPPTGPRRMARSPVTGRMASAYEELIAAECLAAEKLDMRRPVPSWLQSRPGWLAAVLATLQWAWQWSGRPPMTVPQGAVG